MLALHLLQSALVLVNTRLLDRVLDAPAWAERMSDTDRRGLTPLFWSNVALHGTFELDMSKRLDYDRGPRTTDPHTLDPHAAEAVHAPTGPALTRSARSYPRSSDNCLLSGT